MCLEEEHFEGVKHANRAQKLGFDVLLLVVMATSYLYVQKSQTQFKH
jgi:hypothetical protein